MKSTVEVCNVTKIDVLYRKRKRNKLVYLLSLSSLVMCVLCIVIGNKCNINYIMSRVFNPVNSLYNDDTGAVFTSSGTYKDKNSLDFIVPIKASNYSINSDGSINFVAGNTIMVIAIESGVVQDVGISIDGKKYIKIKHDMGFVSIIDGLDIVGVESNNIVKKGQDIATVKIGDQLNLRLYLNDVQLNNLKIQQSKIIWQS